MREFRRLPLASRCGMLGGHEKAIFSIRQQLADDVLHGTLSATVKA